MRERGTHAHGHGGEIRGAFGTIGQHEEGRRGLRSRALALLAIIGPGLIVMVGDNDAGGVATYSQAGQNYGTSLLWVLVLLIPVETPAKDLRKALDRMATVRSAHAVGRFVSYRAKRPDGSA